MSVVSLYLISVLIILVSTFVTAENENEISSNLSKVVGSPDVRDVSKHIRFQDNWASSFPTCSPTTNKYLSPIDILTDHTIELDSHHRTLLIYSFLPIRNYSLLTWYKDPMTEYTASAISIQLDDVIYFQGSYINGIGYDEFQLFRRAIFFFPKNNDEDQNKGWSGHRINGRSFPMEIMASFHNRKSDNHTIKTVTQVFILIQIQDYDNPNFFPVIEAAKIILKMKSKADLIANLTRTLERLTANLSALTQTYNRGGSAAKIENLSPKIHKAMKYMNDIEENNFKKKGVEQLRIQTEHKLQNGTLLKNYDRISFAYFKQINFVYLFSLIANTKFSTMQQMKQIQEKKERLGNLRSSYGKLIGQYYHDIQENKLVVAQLDAENQKHKNEIDGILNEIVGEAKPKTGLELIMFYRTQFQLMRSIKTLQAAINQTNDQLWKINNSYGYKQRMDLFQITWLFPDHGGIYIYNGSNPLPPCSQYRANIVLKNPVGISQKQFDILKSIPAFDKFDSPSFHVAPPKMGASSPDRPVWYNPKNIQWQRDDGIHMKSIFRKKLKLAAARNLGKLRQIPNLSILNEFWILGSILIFNPINLE